ncbi:MAG TPA: hypothetical protein PK590_06205, partial [Candidatus Omnitrophota bacterium]|nr:hypothetical protein [Candidatus Omnitrophota bacterium]
MEEHTVASLAQTAHAVAQSHGEAHELPNFLSILAQLFPDCAIFNFFHRWENVVFSVLVAGFISWRAIVAARSGQFIPKGAQNVWETVTEGL